MQATHAEFLVEPGDGEAFVAFKRGESSVLQETPGSVRRGLLRTDDDPCHFWWTSLWEDGADVEAFGRSPAFVAMRTRFMGRIRPFRAFSRHESSVALEHRAALPVAGDLAVHVTFSVADGQQDAFLAHQRKHVDKVAEQPALRTLQVLQDRERRGRFWLLGAWAPGGEAGRDETIHEFAACQKVQAFLDPAAPPVIRPCTMDFWEETP